VWQHYAGEINKLEIVMLQIISVYYVPNIRHRSKFVETTEKNVDIFILTQVTLFVAVVSCLSFPYFEF